MNRDRVDFEFKMMVAPVAAELCGWESVRRVLVDAVPGMRASYRLRRAHPQLRAQIDRAMVVLGAPGRTLSDKVEIVAARLEAGLPVLTPMEYRDYLAVTRAREARP